MATPDTVERLRNRLREGRALLQGRPTGGVAGARAISDLVDEIVTELFEGVPEGFLLVATGGYGRRELAPHSDVDLLIVHEEDDPTTLSAVVEPLLKALWDLGLEPGAATRTAAETLEAIHSDPTVRTTLLDRRLLHGDRTRWAQLDQRIEAACALQVDEWIETKARELARRRARFGGTVHLLEPNVKQSPGGLRDLHTALWIARAHFGAGDLDGLLAKGILTPSEHGNLHKARDFLLQIRNQLHLLAHRKEDHLTFHWQEEVARALGYEDRPPEGLAVEQFMRDFYLAATSVERFADGIVERSSRRTISVHPQGAIGEEGLELREGKLTLVDRQSLWRDPSLFVKLFVVAERLGVETSPWARDWVREEALRIDEGVRSDPAVCQALRDAFERIGTARWLWEMHREGVLGALLPEFGRVTARHQYDLYHVYTVDIHTLFAMRRLGALLSGDLADEEPRLSDVAQEIPVRLPLSLGVLFHDAGKGLGGHHSEKGADLVERVCQRLQVPDRDREDAVFLVREHLTMSHVSQRRDLSDPDLVAGFAATVGDPRRLDMLYVLTYVDIASVGPGTWTRWKASLLTELYEKAGIALEGGGLREQVLASEAFRAMARYDISKTLIATAKRQKGTSRLLFATADKPGLLASIAGVLAAHRIDVLRADVFSTTDGVAVDFFVVQGPEGGELTRDRWRRARRDLAAVLEGRLDLDTLMAQKLRPSGLPPRHVPSVAPRVRVDNVSSRRFTVVDVVAEDRRGLLHAIAAALHRASLSIHAARIATEGNRAIDSFYVCGPTGEKILEPERIAALEELLLSAIP